MLNQSDDVLKAMVDGAWTVGGVIGRGLASEILTLRQRVNELQRFKDLMLENSPVANENERLKAEIAALKFDQDPVAEINDRAGLGVWLLPLGVKNALPNGTKLFTRPQKPVVLPSAYYGDSNCLDKREVITAIEASGGKVAE